MYIGYKYLTWFMMATPVYIVVGTFMYILEPSLFQIFFTQLHEFNSITTMMVVCTVTWYMFLLIFFPSIGGACRAERWSFILFCAVVVLARYFGGSEILFVKILSLIGIPIVTVLPFIMFYGVVSDSHYVYGADYSKSYKYK